MINRNQAFLNDVIYMYFIDRPTGILYLFLEKFLCKKVYILF